MIILFAQVFANWKRTTNCCVSTFAGSCTPRDCLAKLIHSTAAFSLDRPVAEHNLQLDDLCKKKPAAF